MAITFDTGPLIALERRRVGATRIYRTCLEEGIRVTVPTVVIAEWWRRRTDVADEMLAGMMLEPLTTKVAKLAGAAQAQVDNATTIDAIVMASAALRGDIVYTSDFDDLTRLQAFFPNVRVMAI